MRTPDRCSQILRLVLALARGGVYLCMLTGPTVYPDAPRAQVAAVAPPPAPAPEPPAPSSLPPEPPPEADDKRRVC